MDLGYFSPIHIQLPYSVSVEEESRTKSQEPGAKSQESRAIQSGSWLSTLGSRLYGTTRTDTRDGISRER